MKSTLRENFLAFDGLKTQSQKPESLFLREKKTERQLLRKKKPKKQAFSS
jgi:hypothetical protein